MPNGMRSGVSLLIDIENCIKTQQSAGHERWAKIENLKRAVRTMVFLDQHGFSRYTDLEQKITELQDSNGQTAATLKASERCLSDLALLIKHTATYKELKPLYSEYKKSRDKEKYLRGREREIILFEASAQVTEAGLHRSVLQEFVKSGEMYRFGRGLYVRSSAWEDDFYLLQRKYGRGIYSHDTALYLLGYSDRTPAKYTMTFPKGYNAPSLKQENLIIKRVVPENYEFGRIEIESPSGNPIRVYDLERTTQKRGSGMILTDYPEIMKEIRESDTLRRLWEKYSREYEYAKDIAFDDTCNTIQTIMDAIMV